MNAVSPIIATNQSLSAEDEGNLFRGRVLSWCAQIEWFTSEILRAHRKPVRASDCLGQKLDGLKGLLDRAPALLEPSRSRKLLDDFKKIISFRNDLAHCRLTVARCGTDWLLVFTPSEAAADAGWRAVVLTERDQKDAVKHLRSLRDRLRQLAEPKTASASPSSPPPPKTDAAGGP